MIESRNREATVEPVEPVKINNRTSGLAKQTKAEIHQSQEEKNSQKITQ